MMIFREKQKDQMFELQLFLCVKGYKILFPCSYIYVIYAYFSKEKEKKKSNLERLLATFSSLPLGVGFACNPASWKFSMRD